MKKLFLAFALLFSVSAMAAPTDFYVDGNVGTKQSQSSADVGYQITSTFGAEIGYIDLGYAKPVLNQTTDVGYVAATGTLPVSDKLSLIGKVGGVSTQSNNGNSFGAMNGTLIGAGLRYDVTKFVSVQSEYVMVHSTQPDSSVYQTNKILLSGIQYRF